MPEFIVMMAARPNTTDSHFYVYGPPCTVKDAHRSAEVAYRQERDLPASVFVQTEKLHVAESEDGAVSFLERLVALAKEHEATDA